MYANLENLHLLPWCRTMACARARICFVENPVLAVCVLLCLENCFATRCVLFVVPFKPHVLTLVYLSIYQVAAAAAAAAVKEGSRRALLPGGLTVASDSSSQRTEAVRNTFKSQHPSNHPISFFFSPSQWAFLALKEKGIICAVNRATFSNNTWPLIDGWVLGGTTARHCVGWTHCIPQEGRGTHQT